MHLHIEFHKHIDVKVSWCLFVCLPISLSHTNVNMLCNFT